MKNNVNDNFGNFNLFDKLLTKVAKDQHRTKRFSSEWTVFIVIAIIAGLATSLISIYSGRFFLSGFLASFYTDKGVLSAATIAALLIIEALTYYSMNKAFKFGLKMDVLKFLPTAIFTIMIYSLSFYQSTSGLSIQESSRVDATIDINSNLDVEIENIKLDLAEQTEYYKSSIATIKANPTKWSNGKLSVLSSSQLADIKEYNNTILELKQDSRTQIKELESEAVQDKKNNQTEILSTREKFFGFISVVMIIQIFSSAFLAFSWHQITKENKPEDFVQSKIIDITQQVDASISALWQSRLNSLKNGLSIALNSHEAAGVPLELNTEPIEHNSTIQEAEIVAKSDVGFKAQTGTATSKKKVCLHCEKEYTYKIHNQLYCCEKCRIAAYEKRKGKKLIYKAKK